MPVLSERSNQSSKANNIRPVDIYFDRYAESHQNPTNKLIHWIGVPLMVFGLFGLVWAIPFPYIKFLGQYNGFINWASFLLAFIVYYYYKLSPTLSYGMLLVLFAFSYGVIELYKVQKAGGPAVWLVCGVILTTSLIVEFIGNKIEGKKSSVTDRLKYFLIGPLWLLHLILKQFSVRY